MTIEYKKVDLETMTGEDWKKYHEYRRIRWEETNPDDPIQPDEVVEKSFKQDYTNKDMFIETYMITDSDEDSKQIGSIVMVTFSETNPSYETNKHIAQFDIALLKEYRRQGLATRAIPFLVGFAKKHNNRLFINGVSEKDGKEFLGHLGATFALASKENRLQMKNVDWEMVKSWITEGASLNKTTKLISCTAIPEELLDQYAKFFTTVMNQVPFGDLDIDTIVSTPESIRKHEAEFKELGFTSHTMITIEEDGEISGMTEMLRTPGKDTILSQGLTGVKDSQRGRKLGKWLKAAMLEEMKKQYPQVQVVTTGNADVNAPMLSINHRLGFKAYKETNMAQIAVEKMEEYYNRKIATLIV